jgi:hypothetical protein
MPKGHRSYKTRRFGRASIPMKRLVDIASSVTLLLMVVNLVLGKLNKEWEFLYFFRTDLLIVILCAYIYYQFDKIPSVLSLMVVHFCYAIIEIFIYFGVDVTNRMYITLLTLIITTTIIHNIWREYLRFPNI